MLDIIDHYGYSLAAGYAAKQQTIKAIVCCSSEIQSITFKHDDEQWLAEKASLSQGAWHRNSLAAKCVGALDGLVIEIQKPTSEFSPKQFSNQKGFIQFAVKLYVMLRIIFFSLIVLLLVQHMIQLLFLKPSCFQNFNKTFKTIIRWQQILHIPLLEV